MDEPNPYRSPAAVLSTAAAPADDARLYKVSGIGLAMLIGSALPGGMP